MNAIEIGAIVLLLVALLGCTENHPVLNETEDPFTSAVIENMIERPVEMVQEIDLVDQEIFHPMHPRRDKYGNLIVIDGSRWSISLINASGERIYQTGGSGRGPGEFTGINHVDLSLDNKLLVLDLSQSRATLFTVTENSIQLDRIISINPQEIGGQLRSIHTIDDSFWGVIATPGFNKQFKFVALDSLLRLTREHLELPVHFPNIFLQNRLNNIQWTTAENTFNYIYYDSLVVYSYDVTSEVLERFPLHEPHIQRFPTDLNKDYMAQAYGSQWSEYPGSTGNQPDRNSLELAQFTHLAGRGDSIIGNVLYMGGDSTILISYNFSTRQINYIKAPAGFFIQDVRGDYIIGTSNMKIVVLKMGGNA